MSLKNKDRTDGDIDEFLEDYFPLVYKLKKLNRIRKYRENKYKNRKNFGNLQ
jgi:hypothetical protein